MHRRVPGPLHPISRRYGWTLGLMLVLITLGSLFGAFTVNMLELAERAELMAYMDDVLTAMTGGESQDVAQDLGSQLLALQGERMALRLLLLWLAGLTVIGLPVVLGYTFLHAFSVGFTVAFMVYQKGLPGLALGSAALLPQNLFIFPALVLIGAAALSYASGIWDRSPIHSWSRSAAAYSAACAAAALLLAAAVMVEAYLAPVLMAWVSAYLS